METGHSTKNNSSGTGLWNGSGVMNEESQVPMTLAQSLIAQGLITNPDFIRAAQLQAKLLKDGSYRLLGSILANLNQNNQEEPTNLEEITKTND